MVLFDVNGNQIQSTNVSSKGDNSFQTVALDALGVGRMEIVFAGSGAVSDVIFCRDGHAVDPASTRFFVVDADVDSVFRYDADGNQIDDFAVVPAAVSRGVTSNPDGSLVWVVKSNERVVLHDGTDNSELGNWHADGPNWARGIANQGDDLWIVDGDTDRVFFYGGWSELH